ncbi:MAG: PTS sugar transporter subunit IIA [Hyphomonadaceae bacterium]|nr:PTS sugar transporter subunit IIA [Hyphomonadaceae bacterium]MBC6412365.1 PTS sugar transporter subunit IIA [Hyphomonadaceae bacterium]
MIGLVIVTHGQLAAELRRATEHVVGDQTHLETVCIGPDDDMERRRADIRAAIGKVQADKGVIILTDMFGGTPSNLAISLLEQDRVEVIAGVNLPMLIKLIEARDSVTLSEAANKAKDAGRRYIAIASQILTGDT